MKRLKARVNTETGQWSMDKEDETKYTLTPEDALAAVVAAPSAYRVDPELPRATPLQRIERDAVKHHAKAPTKGRESWSRVLRYGLSLSWRRLNLPSGLAKGSTSHHSLVVDQVSLQPCDQHLKGRTPEFKLNQSCSAPLLTQSAL